VSHGLPNPSGHGIVGAMLRMRWQRVLLRHLATTSIPAQEPRTLATKGCAVGIVAGCAGSLVGLGGGFLSVPLMTSSFLGLSQHCAHATSLLGVLTTGAAGAVPFALAGHVDWGAAAAIAGGGVLAVRLGAQVAERMPAHALKFALGSFLICVAPMVMLKPLLLQAEEPVASIAADPSSSSTVSRKDSEAEFDFAKASRLMVLGGVVGLLGGIFGVGGGSVAVPALSLGCGMSHHEALGTSLVSMVPTACVGVARHASAGTMNWPAGIGLAVGSLVAAFAGAQFIAQQMDEMYLRAVFAALMSVLGARTVQSSVQMWRALQAKA